MALSEISLSSSTSSPMIVSPDMKGHKHPLETTETKTIWNSVQEILQVTLESWAHVSNYFLSNGTGTFCHWVLWDLLPSMARKPFPKCLGSLSRVQPHQRKTQQFSIPATRAAFWIPCCEYLSGQAWCCTLVLPSLKRLRQEAETCQAWARDLSKDFTVWTVILPPTPILPPTLFLSVVQVRWIREYLNWICLGTETDEASLVAYCNSFRILHVYILGTFLIE